MAKFSFLELSFDPKITSEIEIEKNLSTLGFAHRSQHGMDLVGFWSHDSCIILLRRDTINSTPRITGIGLIGNLNDIEMHNATFDRTSDFFVCDNTQGFKTYLVMENQLGDDLREIYQPIDMISQTNFLSKFSGIVLNCNTGAVRDHYQALGFRMTKNTNNYDTLVGPENNFTIMCSKSQKKSVVPTIICDCHDVFKATAYFSSQNCDLQKFEDQPELNFGHLNHKILGYNCRAWGNENSYTIENFIQNAINNTDIIIRQRNKYIHILEETIDSYYEQHSN